MVRLSFSIHTGKDCVLPQYLNKNLSLFFKAVISKSYLNFLITFLLVASSVVMKAKIIRNNRVL